jgi:peptidyl-prolyl cis-trans isomerase B (cyclophilin B)
MSRVVPVAVASMTAFVLAGCGAGSNSNVDNPTVGTQPSTPAPAASGVSCQPAPTAKPSPQQYKTEPPMTIARATYKATIVTNCGTIVLSLDGKAAPHTVNSFAFLAGKHFFDDTPCHRLTTAGIFVLQCGDPTGSGMGGPGYTLPEENLKGATYPAGTVAMARTQQPHSGGSQFFLVYADTQLPPDYTPFAHVVSGLDVLLAIAKAGTDNSNGQGDGHPNQAVVIESFTVTRGG